MREIENHHWNTIVLIATGKIHLMNAKIRGQNFVKTQDI